MLWCCACVQVILTAASFDEELWTAIGHAIADEGRGKHNQCVGVSCAGSRRRRACALTSAWDCIMAGCAGT